MNRVKTKSGDIVHVSECNENDVTYGVISIKLKNKYHHLSDAEQVLIHFIRQLQPIFAVQHTTGIYVEYEPYQSKIAVVDYWQDVERKDFKIKGWTNGNTMEVFYIKNIGNVPVTKEDFFLNGLLFKRW